MIRVLIVLALLPLMLLPTACGVTLPGHQAGPGPRSTQYTYPGRAVNPETGVARTTLDVARPTDGGVFAFGLVFSDGTTSADWGYASFAECERERLAYIAVIAERMKQGGAPVMTITCYRAHETGVTQTR